jgi:uncharacterized protein (TIGR03437 family)
MKMSPSIAGLVCAFAIAIGGTPVSSSVSGRPWDGLRQSIEESYLKLPLNFEPNLGQASPGIRFIARSPGYSIQVKPAEILLRFAASDRRTALKRPGDVTRNTHNIVRMQLVGGNESALVQGLLQLSGRSNYFTGNNPRKWLTNIAHYARVRCRGIYPGIDLIYYGNGRQLEFDLVVAPGAEFTKIELSFKGAQRPRIDSNGDLVLKTPGGRIRQHAPVVYQEVNGSRKYFAARYMLKPRGHIGFQVVGYNPRYALVIDPSLTYSTYLGGGLSDRGRSIAVDASGNAYVTGYTDSLDFPARSGLQDISGGAEDAFVTKLNAAGTAIVYSSYLGGDRNDNGYAIAVDSSGGAYVTGVTQSTNFPTTSRAFQTEFGPGRSNAFITKLDPTGAVLIYSTYLGGSLAVTGDAIAVDSIGNAYVTGGTTRNNFPTTPGAVQPFPGGENDAFVTKLDPTGTSLMFSTYLGGAAEDRGFGIAIDSFNNVYVAGTTASSDFPITLGAFQTDLLSAGREVFVTKLDPTGSIFFYSTYIGGSEDDEVYGLAVDSEGNAYITGSTASLDFPTTVGAFQPSYRGGFTNAFVTKLNDVGSALVYSTYLGGNVADTARSIVLDASNNAFVTGSTASINFPTTPDAFQRTLAGGIDAFVTELDSSGAGLLYSTYLGGINNDDAFGIAVDRAGAAYVSGETASLDFPITSGAFQTNFRGSPFDAWIAKIGGPRISPGGIVNAASYAGGGVAPGEIVSIFGSGLGPATLTGLTLSSSGLVATSLAGTTVLFDGIPAPLIFAEAGQLNAVVPFGVAGRATTEVQVQYKDSTSNKATVPLVASAPGLFTLNFSGDGQGAILNEDGSVNSASNPAARGSVVSLWATGGGQTSPPGVDGAIVAPPLPVLTQSVSVTIGGAATEVQFAGAAPGLVTGVIQVNVLVPSGIAPGSDVPVVLTIGNAGSQAGVTIALR